MILLLLACSDSLAPPNVSLVEENEHFLSRPWPSDLRRNSTSPDLSGWENKRVHAIIDRFIEEAKQLDGFGTNTPVYFQLNGVPKLDILPAEEDQGCLGCFRG